MNDRRRAAASTTAPFVPRTALRQVLRRRSVTPGPQFEPLPPAPGDPPYRRELAEVLSPETLLAIDRDEEVRFHCVGDTGGWRDPRPQRRIADAMVTQLCGPAPPHFFYHLGDIVYPHGEEANYRSQFFAPYAAYEAPIFAVPGNHDGEVTAFSRADPLEPFMRTFCSSSPPLHDAAIAVPRPASAQPNVYWTLVHDWLSVIGLYTNVHEDGEIAADQLDWLAGELSAAPPGVTLILTVHRPVYSVDIVHGSNLSLGDALDDCFARSGRVPDAVLSAHSHNYQRFRRRVGTRDVPYVVAGAGGFHERHQVGTGIGALPATFPGLPEVTLEAYDCSRYGFMTVMAGPAGARGVYTVVANDGAVEFDAFPIVPARST